MWTYVDIKYTCNYYGHATTKKSIQYKKSVNKIKSNHHTFYISSLYTELFKSISTHKDLTFNNLIIFDATNFARIIVRQYNKSMYLHD